MSDNEIYLLIKYIKSVLWRVAKRLSYIEEARCLKVNRLWRVHNEGLHYLCCSSDISRVIGEVLWDVQGL